MFRLMMEQTHTQQCTNTAHYECTDNKRGFFYAPFIAFSFFLVSAIQRKGNDVP